MPKSVGTINARDYVKWVQRSLNRALKILLLVDGKVTKNYRNAVEQFNKKFVTKSLDAGIDEVGVVTQNAIILKNEKDTAYIEWVQEGLNITGAAITVSGKKSSGTKTAIKGFQAFHGLKDDGFVGAKTELALINELKSLKSRKPFPPGHFEAGIKPKPKAKKPFFKSGPVTVKLPHWMTKEAKEWARKSTKTLQIRRFDGNRRHWGDVIIWKNSRKVDAYLEKPIDLDYIRDKLPSKYKDLAENVREVNKQYNEDMSFYVEVKRLSPTQAEARYRKQWGDILYNSISGLTTF